MSVADVESKLVEWTVGAGALELLRVACRAGLPGWLADPRSPEEFASVAGIDAQQAGRICHALLALGVVTHTEGRFCLHPDWVEALGAQRPLPMDARLEFVAAWRNGLAHALDPAPGFAGVDPAEAVALACGVWGVATSPAALQSWAALDDAMPEVREVWRNGGRHAEFGCGAGRDLVRVAAMYPGVQCVGYELLPPVMEAARELARAAGVEGRVELRRADVREVDVNAEFDTLVWSQMFFPEPTREAAIGAVRRALRPGGYVVIPLMADRPGPEAITPSTPHQLVTLVAVSFVRWGILWPTADALRAEMEAQGFTHRYTLPHPRTAFMVMRSPS
ncbi:MAG: class I SAM-dependent methyltransferase [Rubrivivax sp.]|nr:class I SAM-dependent methyltransferase [Rubrivivax sp.]